MGNPERTNVIVVGAGASQEFGLPTGAQLTGVLQSDLSFKSRNDGYISGTEGDRELKRATEFLSREAGKGLSSYWEAALQISRNMPLAPSIDNFLDTHRSEPDLVAVGKLAIANAIMRAERRSKLFVDPSSSYSRLNFKDCQQTWASVFFKIIAAKRDYQSFLDAMRNITFISFNYDRCIKQFFVNASLSYFELDQLRGQEVYEAIKVIHPYGNIGELYWEGRRLAGFGVEPDGQNILCASKRIKTFTEGVEDTDLLASIRKPLEDADVTIFLGFHFIDINMDILKPERGGAQRVLATAKGRSEDTKKALKRELGDAFVDIRWGERAVELFSGKCFELFYEFDRYLEGVQP